MTSKPVATILAIATLGAWPGAAVAGIALTPALARQIDDSAQHLIAAHNSAGLSIAIMSDGKIVYSRGFGSANLEDGAPVTPDTVFRIGSISKQFTAAAIVHLKEEGKLKFDDPLSRYFPDFPRGNDVTIRELLNHTSGIHNFTELPEYQTLQRQDETTDQMVAIIAHQPQVYDFAPGTAWNYSNSGYYLLGAIVEKASGKPLADYIRQLLFVPSGMSHTALDDNADIVPHRARGYTRDADAPGGFHNASYISMTIPGGAGRLRSTTGDLLAWCRALFGGQVVNAEDFREMTTPARLKDGKPAVDAIYFPPGHPHPAAASPMPGYGFGLMIGEEGGHAYIGHGGGINGFNAMLRTYPREHVSFAILSNTEGGVADETRALGKLVEANLR